MLLEKDPAKRATLNELKNCRFLNCEKSMTNLSEDLDLDLKNEDHTF